MSFQVVEETILMSFQVADKIFMSILIRVFCWYTVRSGYDKWTVWQLYMFVYQLSYYHLYVITFTPQATTNIQRSLSLTDLSVDMYIHCAAIKWQLAINTVVFCWQSKCLMFVHFYHILFGYCTVIQKWINIYLKCWRKWLVCVTFVLIFSGGGAADGS